MTENLAGRGEGLAGLTEAQIRVIVYDALKNQFPAEGAAMMVASCCAEPIRRALEAAAPAGTAHNELSLVRLVLSAHQTAYAKFHNGEGRGVIEADQMAIGYASVELAKALATPSPQAPTCICGASSIFPKISCPVHGLQEPAGSGAGELGVGDLVVVPARVIGVKPYLRVVVDGTEPKTPSALVMKPGFVRALNDWRTGSPRKVGEDGQYQCFFCKEWFAGHEAEEHFTQEIAKRDFEHWWECYYDTMGLHGSSQFKTIEGACRDAWIAAAPKVHTRPSSVPVGEQKQEDGV